MNTSKDIYKVGQYYTFTHKDVNKTVVRITRIREYSDGEFFCHVKIIDKGNKYNWTNKGFDSNSPIGVTGIHLKGYDSPLWRVLNEY